MIYLKHYWMRDGKYLTEPGQNGSLQYHPGAGIDGFSVHYWLTDSRGVDYCLSTASDNALVQEVNPGMEIITKQEWDAIVATIPAPEPMPQPAGAPDWTKFKQTAVVSPSLNLFVGSLIEIAPVAATALPATLLLLETGNQQDFENTWNAIKAATTVPPLLVEEFVALAEECNLPSNFVAIFSNN